MNFLHPSLAVAGAIGIAIPIVIHLLMRRRRTPVPWAAMRFLLEAYKKQRRRLQVEQLLLLAARCLLIGLLGAAIAGPLFGTLASLSRGPRSVVIVLDNSLTSGAVDASGKSALDLSKIAAAGILSQLSVERGDTAGLITLGGPADATVMPPSTDLAGLRTLVQRTPLTDSRADLPGAFERIASGFSAAPPAPGVSRQVVVLSELRTGAADAREPLPPLGNSGALLLAGAPSIAELDNVSIAGVAPLRSVLIGAGDGATGSDPVMVELHRSGPGVNAAASSLVKIRVLNAAGQGPAEPSGTSVVRWSAGQELARVSVPTTLPARITGSRLILEASIDRDAVEADNVRDAVVQTRDRVQVAVLDTRPTNVRASIDSLRPADWFALALDPSGATSSGAAGVRIGYEAPRGLVSGASSLSGYDAIFVPDPRELGEPEWTRLRAFADAGGLVIVAPPGDPGAQTWTEAFSRSMALSWTFERDPRTLSTPARIAADSLRDSEGVGAALLGLISAELPELSKAVSIHRVLAVTAPAEEQVLSLADGTPLLLAATPGSGAATAPGAEAPAASRGMVILFTSALDLNWTDLPAKPLSVPLIQELIRQGVGHTASSTELTAGVPVRVFPGASELRGLGSDSISIPVDALGRAGAPVRKAGLLSAIDSRGRDLAVLAVNPDVRAGQTRPLAKEAAEAWLSKAAGSAAAGTPSFAWLDDAMKLPEGGAAGGKAPRDTSISFYLLLIAAALALIETVLARVVSHAGQSRRASALTLDVQPTIQQEAA